MTEPDKDEQLVERLRTKYWGSATLGGAEKVSAMCLEAAAALERLQAELAETQARARGYSEELGVKDARETLLLSFVRHCKTKGARTLLETLEGAEALTTPAREPQYYRSCGSCKWQIDTDEDDRHEGRCPKCGGVTLQWAKPQPSAPSEAERRVVKPNFKSEADRLEDALTKMLVVTQSMIAGHISPAALEEAEAMAIDALAAQQQESGDVD